MSRLISFLQLKCGIACLFALSLALPAAAQTGQVQDKYHRGSPDAFAQAFFRVVTQDDLEGFRILSSTASPAMRYFQKEAPELLRNGWDTYDLSYRIRSGILGDIDNLPHLPNFGDGPKRRLFNIRHEMGGEFAGKFAELQDIEVKHLPTRGGIEMADVVVIFRTATTVFEERLPGFGRPEEKWIETEVRITIPQVTHEGYLWNMTGEEIEVKVKRLQEIESPYPTGVE